MTAEEEHNFFVQLLNFQDKVKTRFCHEKVICVMPRWQTDEEAQFSPSDTFKTRLQDSVTTRWQTAEEEHKFFVKLLNFQNKVKTRFCHEKVADW